MSQATTSSSPARFPLKLGTFASLLMGLAACGDSTASNAPGAVSKGEAEALDEAAEMLDARRLPPEVLPTAAADPQTENSPEITVGSAGDAPQ